MATTSQIKVVRELLGPDAETNGWDDIRIGLDIDSGLTNNQIALAWWSYWSAQTSVLTNVSEGGSSRSLSDIHRAASDLAKLYLKATNEDAKGDPQDAPRGYVARQSVR